MDPRLFASLYDVIDKWMEKNCEEDIWPDIFIDSNLSKNMTNAAATVFSAVMDNQHFVKQELGSD